MQTTIHIPGVIVLADEHGSPVVIDLGAYSTGWCTEWCMEPDPEAGTPAGEGRAPEQRGTVFNVGGIPIPG